MIPVRQILDTEVPAELVTAFCFGLLAVVIACSVVFSCLALHVVIAASTDLKKLHIQQATIVGMLLRAGFKPMKGSMDWADDALVTMCVNEAANQARTRVDLRTPEQRHTPVP